MRKSFRWLVSTRSCGGSGRFWRHAVFAGLLALAANRAGADDLPFTAVWTTVDLAWSNGLEYQCVLPDGHAVFATTRREPGDIYPTYLLVLFDPQSNTWEWKSPQSMSAYQLLPLSDGRCFFMRRLSEPPFPTYIWDPATDVYTRKADMTIPVGYYEFGPTTAMELPNHEVYVFGPGLGYDEWANGCAGFIYNLENDTWRAAPRGPDGSFGWETIIWPDGSAFVHAVPYPIAVEPAGPTIRNGDVNGCSLRGKGPFCSVGWRGYTVGWPSDYSYTAIYSVDRAAIAYREFERRTGVVRAKCFASMFSVAGRDWLCFSYSTNDLASADYGLYDSQVYDEFGGRWLNLPRCPRDLLAVTDNSGNQDLYQEAVQRIPMPDGFLLISTRGGSYNDGVVRAARLQVSAAPVPPQVAANLPANLNLDEGTSQVLSYSVIGDIPAGGVEVVVERLSGDGDVRVVDGASQRVLSRTESMTVRVAGLTDTDSADDQAVIRFRVVQAGGGADPNARTIPVTVRDLYHDGNQPPAIVSPAWANPNPAPLAAGTTAHVVASDPDGDALAYAWSQASGGGTASFAAPDAADSGVAFSAAGTYVLRVTVSDGKGGSVTSDVTVAVTDGSGADPRADCNGDQVVNALDLQIVIANFGKVVP